MIQLILSRLATSLLVIFGASVLVYCIMYLLPGDPVLLMLDPSSATPEMIANLRHSFRLDQPFISSLRTILAICCAEILVNPWLTPIRYYPKFWNISGNIGINGTQFADRHHHRNYTWRPVGYSPEWCD